MAALSTSNQEQMFGFICPLAGKEIRGLVSLIVIVVAVVILSHQKEAISKNSLLLIDAV